jgi:hypothetical protein
VSLTDAGAASRVVVARTSHGNQRPGTRGRNRERQSRGGDIEVIETEETEKRGASNEYIYAVEK